MTTTVWLTYNYSAKCSHICVAVWIGLPHAISHTSLHNISFNTLLTAYNKTVCSLVWDVHLQWHWPQVSTVVTVVAGLWGQNWYKMTVSFTFGKDWYLLIFIMFTFGFHLQITVMMGSRQNFALIAFLHVLWHILNGGYLPIVEGCTIWRCYFLYYHDWERSI